MDSLGLDNPIMVWINITSILVIGIVLFLALRAFWLWYFRLNQIADDIHYIAEYYRRQQAAAVTKQQPAASPTVSARPPAAHSP